MLGLNIVTDAKYGQRWLFNSNDQSYIIEINQININGTKGMHTCKVLQIVSNHAFKDTTGRALRIGDAYTWTFEGTKDNWSYMEGQDKP